VNLPANLHQALKLAIATIIRSTGLKIWRSVGKPAPLDH